MKKTKRIFIFILCLLLPLMGLRVYAEEDLLLSVASVPDIAATDRSEAMMILYNDAAYNIDDLNLNKSDVAAAESVCDDADLILPSETADPEALLEEVNSKPEVLAAFYDLELTTQTLPNELASRSDSVSYYYTNIQVDQTWDYVGENNPVTVAVLDSGCVQDNEDLAGRVEAVIDTYTPDDPQTDLAGHGTAVTATIVATADNNLGSAGVTGLSDVTVLPYRCGGSTDNPTGISVIAVITALKDIAQNHPEVKVVNMSFSADESIFPDSTRTAFQSACDALADQGVILVAAAGNDGSDVVNLPAGFDSVISVGATDADNALASFSDYNEQVELVAPGSQILTWKLNTLYLMSGTSFSSPITAGVCAWLFSVDDEYEADQIKNAIETTALDLGETGRDIYYGYGLIQAEDAYELLCYQNGKTKNCGDINEDDQIDAIDALLALRHAVKELTLEKGQYYRADINYDQTIDAQDALQILKISVGL